jgi:hypothetical protein
MVLPVLPSVGVSVGPATVVRAKGTSPAMVPSTRSELRRVSAGRRSERRKALSKAAITSFMTTIPTT